MNHTVIDGQAHELIAERTRYLKQPHLPVVRRRGLFRRQSRD
jgi:hypothetical protein